MKKLYCMLIVAMVIPLLGGCLDNGSTYAPPENFAATPGDGRVTLTWTPNYSIDYWVFAATDPSLTAFNWIDLPNAHAYTLVYTPLYLCGLLIGDQYYFAANGRTSGGPGGPSSPTVSAAPYDASTRSWTTGSVGSTANIYGVGYMNQWTCFNSPTTNGAGIFAAVGAGGTLLTSSDNGNSWVNHPAPAGFTSDLYAVTGYTAFANFPTVPPYYPPSWPQIWVAVGKGGNSLYSTDGSNWLVGGSVSNSNSGVYSTTTNNLNAITQVSGIFVAVGDAGTIMFTIDGYDWEKAAVVPTTQNLHGVTHGSLYFAVGDAGTILSSADGSTWTLPLATQVATPPTTSNLRQVAASIGGIVVAVGDNGTIVNSTNNGANWNAQTLPGSPNLISVSVENLSYANALTDPLLGVVPSTEFVAMDSNGNAYNSVNGVNWNGPFATGFSTPNVMFGSGFGYIAAGNGGATAHSF